MKSLDKLSWYRISDKKDLNLWNKLTKELSELDDNNFKARIIYTYIKRYYK